MTEVIQNYIESYQKVCPELTAEELKFIEKNARISELGKGAFYLKAGDIQKDMGFVYRGLLRSFYLDNEGNEITISFIQENGYASDYSAFTRQKPSKFSIQCLEPCTLVNLSYHAMQEGYARFRNFDKYGRLIAEAILVSRQNRIESFLFEQAEQRYLNFAAENPDLLNRISLTHLSSFLGIGRQSLSRIRKKLLLK